jgi:hypothetical protein
LIALGFDALGLGLPGVVAVLPALDPVVEVAPPVAPEVAPAAPPLLAPPPLCASATPLPRRVMAAIKASRCRVCVMCLLLVVPIVNDMRKPVFPEKFSLMCGANVLYRTQPICRMCSLRDTLCTGRARGEFAELFAAAKVFAAACVDGDRRLTDIATREIFPMHAGKFVSSFALDTSRNVGSDACLRPTNRSRS